MTVRGLTVVDSLRTRIVAALENRAHLHEPASCAGCAVSYRPRLTDGCCPVCATVAPGFVAAVRDRAGRAYGLRFVWIFAAVVFLLMVHVLYPG